MKPKYEQLGGPRAPDEDASLTGGGPLGRRRMKDFTPPKPKKSGLPINRVIFMVLGLMVAISFLLWLGLYLATGFGNSIPGTAPKITTNPGNGKTVQKPTPTAETKNGEKETKKMTPLEVEKQRDDQKGPEKAQKPPKKDIDQKPVEKPTNKPNETTKPTGKQPIPPHPKKASPFPKTNPETKTNNKTPKKTPKKLSPAPIPKKPVALAPNPNPPQNQQNRANQPHPDPNQPPFTPYLNTPQPAPRYNPNQIYANTRQRGGYKNAFGRRNRFNYVNRYNNAQARYQQAARAGLRYRRERAQNWRARRPNYQQTYSSNSVYRAEWAKRGKKVKEFAKKLKLDFLATKPDLKAEDFIPEYKTKVQYQKDFSNWLKNITIWPVYRSTKIGFYHKKFDFERVQALLHTKKDDPEPLRAYGIELHDQNVQKGFKLDIENNAQWETLEDWKRGEIKKAYYDYYQQPNFLQRAGSHDYYSRILEKKNFTVFLIPMSHIDIGWLKTYEGYMRETNQIFHNVIKWLSEDPTKKFVIEHTGYLRPFYQQATADDKQKLKKMIKSKRIEILNFGSISSHDEAAPYYQDMLTNYRAGFTWLKHSGILPDGQELKDSTCLKVDSFGHGITTIKLQFGLGAKQSIIGRADSVEKAGRAYENALTFQWKYTQNELSKASKKLKEPAKPQFMLTNLLYQHYSAPSRLRQVKRHLNPLGYRFAYNIERCVQAAKQLAEFADYFKDRQVLSLLGDDFIYQNHNNYFDSSDPFILFVNSQNKTGTMRGVYVKYSTPREYFDTVRKKFENEKNDDFERRRGIRGGKNRDFYPYTNRVSSYFNTGGTWTGFFTAHSWFKKRYKEYSRTARVLKTVLSRYLATRLWLKTAQKSEEVEKVKKLDSALRELEWWVGVLTHHDAITGTSTKVVMFDYLQNVKKRADLLLKEMHKDTGTLEPEICGRECFLDDSKLKKGVANVFLVSPLNSRFGDFGPYYNFLMRERADSDYSWALVDQKGVEVDSRLECEKKSPVILFNKLNGRIRTKDTLMKIIQEDGRAQCVSEHLLPADNTDPQIYHLKKKKIEKIKNSEKSKKSKEKPQKTGLKYTAIYAKELEIVDEHNQTSKIVIKYSEDRKKIQLIKKGFGLEYGLLTHTGRRSYGQYEVDGPYINSFENQTPDILELYNLRYREEKDHYVVLVDEFENGYGSIRLKIFKNWLNHLNAETPKSTESGPSNGSQPSKYIKGVYGVEFYYHFNNPSLSKRQRESIEIFGFYKPIGFTTLNKFKTDSNGLDMVERLFRIKSDRYRETPFLKENNIFPMTAFLTASNAFHKDRREAMGVFVDRACGGVVTSTGVFEIQLLKMTQVQDHKGMMEKVVEEVELRMKHVVLFTSGSGEEGVMRGLRRLQIRAENWAIFLKQKIGYESSKLVEELQRSPLGAYGAGNGRVWDDVFGDLISGNVQVNLDYELFEGGKWGRSVEGEGKGAGNGLGLRIYVTLVNLNDFEQRLVSGLGERVKRLLIAGIGESGKGLKQLRLSGKQIRLNFNKAPLKEKRLFWAKNDILKKVVLQPLEVKAIVIENK